MRESLWVDLESRQPEDICRKASATFCPEGFYSLPFLSAECKIMVGERRILPIADDSGSGEDERTLLFLHYLLNATETPISGKWISEKGLKGGSQFFQGPHAMPVRPLIDRFGSDASSFAKRCRLLGGTPLEYGDGSMSLPALPRIPVGFVIWEADDEFPADATVLLDSSIESHLALDVILGLVNRVIKRIADDG